MRLVVMESPYSGDVERNEKYARECLRDCIKRGESPYASHLLYTQPGVLDDNNHEERNLGMELGFAWLTAAEATVVYIDYGVSDGMKRGIERAIGLGKPIEYRRLFANESPQTPLFP